MGLVHKLSKPKIIIFLLTKFNFQMRLIFFFDLEVQILCKTGFFDALATQIAKIKVASLNLIRQALKPT